MQATLLLLLLADIGGESLRSAVVERYGKRDLLFSPGPTAVRMPRFVYVRDSGLELPVPPWQTDAAYAEAFEIARRGFHESQRSDGARALMVFTSFDEGGQNLFYIPLANDVLGLGDTVAAQIFDDSPGTSLDGYIWMGSLHRLEEAGDAYFREAFLHEIAHRWGSYAAVEHPELARAELRGRQSSHWSFLVDRAMSPMDGNDWVAVGADQITDFSVPPDFAFSPLDLYFMGVLPPESVPPFIAITGYANVSPPWLMITPQTPPAHRTGTPITLIGAGTVDVTIDDIIAASGARVPAAIDQRITWKIGIVFLSNGFSTPTLADFQLLDRRVFELAAEFERASDGRVVLDLAIEGAGVLPPGSVCAAVDDCDRTLSDACQAPKPEEDPICTRSCQSGAVCGAGQCCLEGLCAPARQCGVIDSPGDDGGVGTNPIDPRPGSLVLDGEQRCNCSSSEARANGWANGVLLLAFMALRRNRRGPYPRAKRLSRANRARCRPRR